jgi:hypothetical protein
MKFLILVIILSINYTAYCQKKYVCTIKQHYNELVNTFNEEEKLIINHLEEDELMNGNKAALIEEHIDTLNKDEILNTNFVEESKSTEINKYVGITHGKIENDTMKVNIEFSSGNEQINFKIIMGDYKTTFTEFYKDDKILKLNSSDEPTNKLTMTVDDQALQYCKDGKTVYGYSKFTTEPYFRLNEINSKQYLQIQRTFEFYFKFERQ